MKIKVGLKWKSIAGPSKGKYFVVTRTGPTEITYKSEETGITYIAERKHFEKYIKLVNLYWSKTNKEYKYKKQKIKEE